jgi:glycosyltransferase involved in cell wall biosynthesis
VLKVAVFNTYLGTWGGGERSTYANAAAFAALGFDVEVVSFEDHLPTIPEIEQFFGPGHTGFRLRQLSAPTEKLRDTVLRDYLADKAIFVNHCAGSPFVNPCPLGIYIVMFPLQGSGDWVRSYHHFICNSEYTRLHTLQRWGQALSTLTVYPAAGDAYVAAPQRSLDILSIGRFNWKGHRKNQDVMVEAFADIAELLPRGWRLVLMGKMNALPDNVVAMEALKRRCRGLPIAFELDVSEERKRELLSRASIYWHGTGMGRTEPHEMEHYGISVVEAMRAGVVPLCFNRGGPAEIIEHAKSGFLYRDVEELKAYTLALVARNGFCQTMSANAVERSHAFDRAAFDRQMTAFVRSVVAA